VNACNQDAGIDCRLLSQQMTQEQAALKHGLGSVDAQRDQVLASRLELFARDSDVQLGACAAHNACRIQLLVASRPLCNGRELTA